MLSDDVIQAVPPTPSSTGAEEIATPQQASGAPDQSCPKCGRRMQLLNVSPTTYSYVCYAHSPQNADSIEPYYLNIHYKFLDEKGNLKYANPRSKR